MIARWLQDQPAPGLLLTAGPTPADVRGAPEAFAHLEAAGCPAIWLTDHLFWGRPMPEALTLAAVAATATTSCAVGTGVLQLPLRATASVAKAVATVQDLAGGRFVLGVGVGEHHREYERSDADFSSRGRDLDRQIAVLQQLWSESDDQDWFQQRPAPQPPPIWVGGRSEPAIERAARLDGWMPIFVTPEQFSAAGARLDEALERAQRDASAVARSVTAIAAVATDETAAERARTWCGELWNLDPRRVDKFLVLGSAAHIAERLGEYRAAGAAHVSVLLATDEPVAMYAEIVESGGWGPA